MFKDSFDSAPDERSSIAVARTVSLKPSLDETPCVIERWVTVVERLFCCSRSRSRSNFYYPADDEHAMKTGSRDVT